MRYALSRLAGMVMVLVLVAIGVVLFPGLAVVVTALSLPLLGDCVRDLLDPRLKKSM